LDRQIAALGRLIQHAGRLLSTGLLAIRLRRSTDVRLVIEALSRSAARQGR
jgi:hypothetical protein